MSQISNISSAEAPTGEITETDASASVTTEVEREVEIKAETAAKRLSNQEDIFKKLKEEYAEINLCRERLKSSIDNYERILNQIDFGSVEDTTPSKFVENIYDHLEEHKTQMFQIINGGGDHLDIKHTVKRIILKQILNKRATLIDESKALVYLNENCTLAFNAIIMNPIHKVVDYEDNISQSIRYFNNLTTCENCGNYKKFSKNNNNRASKKSGAKHYTDSFNKKLLAALYTQINSINYGEDKDVYVNSDREYDHISWQEKLFTIFSKENIQRYKAPDINESEISEPE